MKIKWKEFEILNGRPEGMDFAEYRRRLDAQKYLLKLHKKYGLPGTNINPHEEVFERAVEPNVKETIQPEDKIQNNQESAESPAPHSDNL